ncbi:MAG: hypothetical protein RAK22_01275, partial [Nanoarchaeota archaeon]|nr:hypothetical protein [Nanoarchaeota archaeon]
MNTKGQMLSAILIIILFLLIAASISIQSINSSSATDLALSSENSLLLNSNVENLESQFLALNNLYASSTSISFLNNEINEFVSVYYPSYKYVNYSLSAGSDFLSFYPFPPDITAYSSLVISNSQSSATPSPFQQMIYVQNTSAVWSYINTASGYFGQNVEFFYANGTIIPSWLESYSSANAI